jgi:predicted PurR-regulated permease PerM
MAPPQTSATARNALVIIAVVVTGAALRWMGEIITPLLLAMFLAVMVDGFSRVIRTRLPFLPAGAAMLTAIVVSIILVVASTIVVAANTGGFIATLTNDRPRLDALVADISTHLGPRAPASVAQLMNRLDPMQYVGTVAQGLQNFGSAAVLVLIYLGFLIAARRTFERKLVKLFHSRDARHEALVVFMRIRDAVERYLWIQTVTGLIIAAGSFAVMMAVGLDHAFFWAFLVFSLNYIPILGAVAGIALPALFALLQFGEWNQALIVLGGSFAIAFVVGNIFLPRMQGNSLNMDPLIVMMSLGFWGSIWGLPGMFLSTPLTVLVMLVLAQFQGSRWIAILLSGDGDPQGLAEAAAAEAKPVTRPQPAE